MFRRTTGFVFGYVFGLASSWYVVRRLRLRLQRYRPPQVATRLTDGIDAARRTVGVAVSEGRAAMREREAELRSDFAAEPGHETGSPKGLVR